MDVHQRIVGVAVLVEVRVSLIELFHDENEQAVPELEVD